MSAHGDILALKRGGRHIIISSKDWWFDAFAEIGKRTGKGPAAVAKSALVSFLAANGYTGPGGAEPSRPKLMDACRTLVDAIMAKPTH